MEILQNNVDLFALILLSTVGLGLIIYNIILIKKGQQTLNWIETQGQITKSEIGISRNLSDGSVKAYYRANIRLYID